jgi:hypothetical protein
MVFTGACMVHDSGLMIPLCQGNLWHKARTLSPCTWGNSIRTSRWYGHGPAGQEEFAARILQFLLKAIYIYGELLMVEVRLFKHPREFISRQVGPCFTKPPSGCYTGEACLTRGTYRCGGPAWRVQLICSRRRAVVQLTQPPVIPCILTLTTRHRRSSGWSRARSAYTLARGLPRRRRAP